MPKPKTAEKLYIGVDPGASGGVVLLSSEQHAPLQSHKLPREQGDMIDLFSSLLLFEPVFAYIEWIPTAIFGAGKSSCSKLYGNYRELRMALVALEIPFQDVKPKDWQRGMKIPPRKKGSTSTEWKNVLKSKAKELFPSEKVTLTTSDALLIAEWCRRNWGK